MLESIVNSVKSVVSLVEAATYQRNYEERVRKAAGCIREHLGTDITPVFGLTLGSGLGDLAKEIRDGIQIPYDEIPYFPRTAVEGHEGILHVGYLQGVPIIGLQGRKHFYEGADKPLNTAMLDVSFAVNVLAELGVKNYFATNAAGGLNPVYNVGDLMVMRSHLMYNMPNPLLGRKHKFTRVVDGTPTWRFTPMNSAYDDAFRLLLWKHKDLFFPNLHEGVYIAVTGPSYETAAECIAFRDGFRADVVGMSTAPEVIVATNRGMRTVGMSIITNKIAADGTNATNHAEVMSTLDSPAVKERLQTVVRGFFEGYRKQFVG